MPIYEFQDEAGERYEIYFKTFEEVPCGLGEWTTLGGKRLQRLLPSLQRPLTEEDCLHVSLQHPPWWASHRRQGGKFTKDGKTIMTSWAQVEKTIKDANDHGEHVTYDGNRRTIS